VLRDDEPSIDTLEQLTLNSMGWGPLVAFVSELSQVFSRRTANWRVVVQQRRPGRIAPDFADAGTREIPDADIPCSSRAEANDLALRLAEQFMRDSGVEADPAAAPIRLGIGLMPTVWLAMAGAFAGLLVSIGLADLQPVRELMNDPATPVAVHVLLIAVLLPIPVLGAFAPTIVGRAIIRRRRRRAIMRHST